MDQGRDSFEASLVGLLPQLRMQALGLTRNRSAADDLVQDTVANALAARHTFAPGTNLAGWLHRILRNRFVSEMRRSRPAYDLDSAPEAALAVPGQHEDRLVLKELRRALGTLRPEQRAALFLVVLQGMSYAEVAAATGCAVGTAKSRVFRARHHLHQSLQGRIRGRRAALAQPLPAWAPAPPGLDPARPAGLPAMGG